MSGLLYSENALDPRNDFVTGWVRGLVKVDHAGRDVGFDVALQRRAATRDRSEVTSSDEYCLTEKQLAVLLPAELDVRSNTHIYRSS